MATALATGAVGAAVMWGAAEHDIGWGDSGPASGYFPFRIGILIVLASLVNLVARAPAARRRRFCIRHERADAKRARLRPADPGLRRSFRLSLAFMSRRSCIWHLRHGVPGRLSAALRGRAGFRRCGRDAAHLSGLVQGAPPDRTARSAARALLRCRMGDIESLFHGFAVALTVQHVALMMVGVLLGILVGVLPGLGAPERRDAPAAADLHDGSGRSDHPSHQHVLGRAVRRLDDLDPVQHPRRAVLGRDDLRRPPDGQAGPGRPGALLRVPVGRVRRAGRRDRHHACCPAG